MNRVTLMGNLGADPEVRVTTSDKKVMNLRIATSEFYRDAKGEGQVRTSWHNVVAWGNGMIEAVEKNFKKGNKILIEGYLKYESYENTEGQKQHSTKIVMNEFYFV